MRISLHQPFSTWPHPVSEAEYLEAGIYLAANKKPFLWRCFLVFHSVWNFFFPLPVSLQRTGGNGGRQCCKLIKSVPPPLWNYAREGNYEFLIIQLFCSSNSIVIFVHRGARFPIRADFAFFSIRRRAETKRKTRKKERRINIIICRTVSLCDVWNNRREGGEGDVRSEGMKQIAEMAEPVGFRRLIEGTAIIPEIERRKERRRLCKRNAGHPLPRRRTTPFWKSFHPGRELPLLIHAKTRISLSLCMLRTYFRNKFHWLCEISLSLSSLSLGLLYFSEPINLFHSLNAYSIYDNSLTSSTYRNWIPHETTLHKFRAS